MNSTTLKKIAVAALSVLLLVTSPAQAGYGITTAVFLMPNTEDYIEHVTNDIEEWAYRELGAEWYTDIRINIVPVPNGNVQYYVTANNDNKKAVELVKKIIRKYASGPTI